MTGRAVVLVLVVASLVVSYASSLRAWVDQRSQIAAMRAEVEAREERVDELEAELRRWRDPNYVAAQARERFGWVMPGEIGYVVVDEKGRAVGGDGQDEAGTKEPPPWWRTLWGSIETAGKPEEKAKPGKQEKGRPEPAETIRPVDPERRGAE